MPYNTRRKSLSLPSLGIHVPGSHASRVPSTATSSRNTPDNTSRRVSIVSTTIVSHPNKRQKRSHQNEAAGRRVDSSKGPDEQAMLEHTPPPSPITDESMELQHTASIAAASRKRNQEGINDEIVEAVIAQLQATANRPHLVKELATVLSKQLSIVQHSANPCAIISSRLAAYLKRSSWSALAPCPLAKELEVAHPRRTYFYLTTCPRQPFPADMAVPLILQRSVISPSVSSVTSGSDDEDDLDLRRRELSLSPEVDLSSPEFDDADDDFAMPTTPVGSLPNTLRHDRSHRSASPPLEKDEREFTQTADVLQKRKLARDFPLVVAGEHCAVSGYDQARDDAIFDEKQNITVNGGPAPMHFITSPAVKASLPSSTKRDADGDSWLKLGTLLEWDHSPENIELDELDCLLDSC
ncbi:mucin [Colletotrichum truncatum]|uniref:Mucin n=1 Tax=Colletotrichum truncatum TaxID=5467 RepID=A0ACC3YQK0_COLTU|nr:mucin [Colletotrichum truncatum]KAF6796532.1 mucin [Colletotrichum truncatum]